MQKINKRQGLMLCSTGLLVVVMLSVLVRFGTWHILIKRANMDNFITEAIFVDYDTLHRLKSNVKFPQRERIVWEDMYPFTNNRPVKKVEFITLEKITKKAESIKKRIDNWTNRNLLGYAIWREIGNSYEVSIGWNLIQPMPLGDGSWSFVYPKSNVNEKCESIVSLARFVESNGKHFLYVQAPRKVDPYEDFTIDDVFDFTNRNMDNAIARLQGQGVDILDLRQAVYSWANEDNVSCHSFFFRTDHHWKSETALRAAKVIVNKLGEYGIEGDTSHYDLNGFDVEILPKWFLGSEGRYATLSRVVPDDFSILHPKFATHVHYKVPELKIDDIGDLEITYNKEVVAVKDFYNAIPYSMYWHSDKAIANIENLLLPLSDKKVLLIRDSFGDPMGTFLALGVKNLTLLDLRYFTGSVREYISRHNPDVVMLMYFGAPVGKINWSGQGRDKYDFR